MKSTLKITLALAISLTMVSCFEDLNTVPLDEDVSTPNVVFADEDAYLAVLAKCYAGLAVTGQQGPAGDADIGGIDEGFSSYVRLYWKMQELPTEEAIIGWNDQTIKDFHDMDWTSADGFIAAMYYRIFYQVAVCNEFLRQSSDDLLDERGASQALRSEIEIMRAEARFLRALSYWHGLDFFRNIPFVTEEDPIGSFFPEQRDAAFVFDFIESELLEIESQLMEPTTAPYGRADRAAAWMLLAKLYLNAEQYIGDDRSSDALEYAERVVNSDYSLHEDYEELFLADNNEADGIVFPVNFDGNNTRTWGGTTFIVRASIGGDMDAMGDFGVNNGWGGLRTTPQLPMKWGESVDPTVIDFNFENTPNYTKLYMPGDYQGFDYSNTETTLSSPEGNMIYEGYRYFPEDNMSFQFTILPNDVPAFIRGDDDMDGILDVGGAPIVAGAAGVYRFLVDLNDNSYLVERVEWSIAGSAVVAGSVPLQWDEESQTLNAELDLVEGSFRFVGETETGGTLTLGDDGSDSILEYDGIDIDAGLVGPSEVFLELKQRDFTMRLNSTSFDRRPIFTTEGQTLSIDDITDFSNGYAVSKFKNIDSEGNPGINLEHVDTDFPMFRMADAYLMAAEAILRTGGDVNTAVDYVNALRERSYKSSLGNISATDLDLDFILEERARELYWEAHRRTDLIRFGRFTSGDYLWEWKGDVKEGRGVEAFRTVYPIPDADINANPNLEQNEGY